MASGKTSLKQPTQDYLTWGASHPIGKIPAAIAKEGAGENRIPFTHLANSVPVYLVFRDIIRHAKKTKASVIDIGCGTGRTISFVKDTIKKPAFDFYGIDYSSACISFARSQYGGLGVQFAQYAGGIIPYPDESFDFLVSSHVLEHIPKGNTSLFFSEISRVLKKGGVAVIGTPNRKYCQDLFAINPSDSRKFRLILPHEHEYYFDELKKALAKKSYFKTVTIHQTMNLLNRSLMIQAIDKIKPKGGIVRSVQFALYHVLRSQSTLQDLMARLGTEYLLRKQKIDYDRFIGQTYVLSSDRNDDGDNLIVIATK